MQGMSKKILLDITMSNGTQVRGMFRPCRHGRNEVIAYDVNMILKLNRVPPTEPAVISKELMRSFLSEKVWKIFRESFAESRFFY